MRCDSDERNGLFAFCGSNKFKRHIRTFAENVARYLAWAVSCADLCMRARVSGESGHLSIATVIYGFFFIVDLGSDQIRQQMFRMRIGRSRSHHKPSYFRLIKCIVQIVISSNIL